MGSPLGPVLTGIFMVELKTQIIPTLENMVLNLKSFVDDTIGSVKVACVSKIKLIFYGLILL